MTVHKLAILVAPWKDRTRDDELELYDAKVHLLMRGWLPIFLPDTLVEVLDDDDPRERRAAVQASAYFCSLFALHTDVNMVVIGERMSEGMTSDVQAWLAAGGPAPMNINELVVPKGKQEEG